MASEILGELQQFGPIQLAIPVGIETHRMFNKTLRRQWCAGTAARLWAAISAARPGLAALAGAFAGIVPRTGSGGLATGPLSPRAGRVIAGTIVLVAYAARPGPWFAVIGSLRPRALGARSEVSAVTDGPSVQAQFIRRQFAVAVLVELLKRGGCIGNFLGGKFAVPIGVEGFHQRAARPDDPALPAGA
jgi:hypothetical protein